MDSQASKAVLDQNGNPIPSGALTTRVASLDVGRLDLLDPINPDARTLEALERRVQFRETLTKLALRQTSVSQWCVFKAEGEEARETIYPMGAAAAAMFSFFGLTWATIVESTDTEGRPIFIRGPQRFTADLVNDGDGKRYWWVTAGLWQGDNLVQSFEGKRQIGSGYAKNEFDAKMDAFENLQSRAARWVFGLAGKTRDDFAKLGLDLSKARIAAFQDRKSTLSEDPNEATVRFGNAVKENGGKPVKVADLSDKDLEWYAGVFEKDVKDPAKAKFKPEVTLKAIRAEQERRAAAPAVAAEDQEEFEKTVAQFLEEGAALGISDDKLKKYAAEVKTLPQAKKALATYQERRKKKAAEEPGAEG